MLIGFGDKVQRLAHHQQLGDAVLTARDKDGIVQDGSHSRSAFIYSEHLTIRTLDSTQRSGNEMDMRSLRLKRLLHRLQFGPVNAIGDQEGYASALDRILCGILHTEGGRTLNSTAIRWGQYAWTRIIFGYRYANTLGHAHSQIMINMVKQCHLALAHLD